MADTPAAPERESLVARIAAAMAEAGAVTKSEVNRDQGYKFASAEAILAAVRGPLFSRGVILIPTVVSRQDVEITSRSGTKGSLVRLEVAFRFTDGSEDLVSCWHGEGQDYGDKAIGKAYTNAVKTYVRTAWLLPTEHDDPEVSPSGERTADVEPPVWAKPASGTARQHARDALVQLVGDEPAAQFMAAIEQYAGGAAPSIVTRTILGLATRIEQTQRDPSADPSAGSVSGDRPTTLDRAMAAFAGASGLEPGGDPDCTCPDAANGKFDDDCPIPGHGTIPF